MKTLLAITALASAGADPAKFDLVCKGTLTTISLVSGVEEEPYERLLRVDLAQKKYCEDECKALFDIVEVGPTQITLRDKDSGPGINREQSKSYVNRVTGKHHSLVTSGGVSDRMTMTWKGACEPRAFSGFPVFETKF